jgi:hypothetical protein
MILSEIIMPLDVIYFTPHWQKNRKKRDSVNSIEVRYLE